MNITKKIILTDTNILTDLDIAGILGKFVNLDNVYMSDLVKDDEINSQTCNLEIAKNIKTIKATDSQINEMINLSTVECQLSIYDIINYVLARDNDYIIATGDKKLKQTAHVSNVEVIGTIGIIDLLEDESIITTREKYQALINLRNHPKIRLPLEEIDKRLEKIENELVVN